MSFVISKLFLLSSPSRSFFLSSCFFSTEYDDMRGGMGRIRRGRDDVLFAPSSRSRGRKRVCVPLFLVLYSPRLLFSSSRCSYYPIISFFVMIDNRRFGVGPDRTDEVGDGNARKTRQGGGNGYVSCDFLFSTLLISSSLFSYFPIV